MVIAFRCRVTLTANSTGVPSLSDRNQEAAACVDLPNERPPYLHEDVLTRVRDLIVEGHIAAGARISAREICDALGDSRMLLREALKVLAAEGVVELLPNRGARVRRFEEEIRYLFEVLAGLEFVTGRLARERNSDDEIGGMHCIMYAHYMGRELPEYYKLNREIHGAIRHAARNQVLLSQSESLSRRLQQVPYSANMVEGSRWSDAMSEHELMFDALHRRAGSDLGEILYEHIMGKCEAACTFLQHADEAQAAPPRASSL
jgi:DNA-binding GntR family transcriptional regulator